MEGRYADHEADAYRGEVMRVVLVPGEFIEFVGGNVLAACDRWGDATLASGIDLDFAAMSAMAAILRGEDVEAGLALLPVEHPGHDDVATALRVFAGSRQGGWLEVVEVVRAHSEASAAMMVAALSMRGELLGESLVRTVMRAVSGEGSLQA